MLEQHKHAETKITKQQKPDKITHAKHTNNNMVNQKTHMHNRRTIIWLTKNHVNTIQPSKPVIRDKKQKSQLSKKTEPNNYNSKGIIRSIQNHVNAIQKNNWQMQANEKKSKNLWTIKNITEHVLEEHKHALEPSTTEERKSRTGNHSLTPKSQTTEQLYWRRKSTKNKWKKLNKFNQQLATC